MKPILKYSAFVLLIGLIFHPSCKKEYSCEGCINGNKPPIANAGPDQVITLPTDSVSLDGRQSNDPDGTISSFLWAKISGPSSSVPVSTIPQFTLGYSLSHFDVFDLATNTWSISRLPAPGNNHLLFISAQNEVYSIGGSYTGNGLLYDKVDKLNY